MKKLIATNIFLAFSILIIFSTQNQIKASSSQNFDSLTVVDSLIIKTSLDERKKYVFEYNDYGSVEMELKQEWISEQWVNEYKFTNKYNSEGQQIEFLHEKWNGEVWESNTRMTYEYHEDGNVRTITTEVWESNTWELRYKSSHTYNSEGQKLDLLTEQLNGNEWSKMRQELFEYNDNKYLVEQYIEWTSNPWLEKEKYTYDYDSNGNRTSSLYEYTEMDIWQNQSRYFYYYDPHGTLDSTIMQFWVSDSWENESYLKYSYNENGQTEEVIVGWWRDEWVFDGRCFYNYNDQNNMVLGLARELYEENLIEWNYSLEFHDSFGREYEYYGKELNVYYSLITDLDDQEIILSDFRLHQNYPNPFNNGCVIKYSIPEKSQVELKVFDVLGREVSKLLNKQQQAGSYQVSFDANELTSGIYLYRLQAGSFVESRKMVLVK